MTPEGSKSSQEDAGRRRPFRLKIGRYLVLIWIVVLGITFVPGDRGLYHLWKQRRKVERVKSDIERLKKERIELEEKIKLLESDLDYIERVAREEYGMALPGETVYRISFSKKEEEDRRADDAGGEEVKQDGR